MKKLSKILSPLVLLVVGSAAQSSEIDDLINTSSAIVGKIDLGTALVGSALTNSYGGEISRHGISGSAHITQQELQSYNQALSNMSNYLPYGDAQTFLESKAGQEIALMNEAVDVFMDVVVDMAQVVEVAEVSQKASTPNEQQAVKEYVETNYEQLQITEAEVEVYNQSLTDIETHANTAGAYIGLSNSKDATSFLAQGAENNNATFDESTISFNAHDQYAKVSWASGNSTQIYLNGTNFGLDLYVSDADLIAYGQQSEFYSGSPTALGYNCFINQVNCEYKNEL
jgi:hypothetical protein